MVGSSEEMPPQRSVSNVRPLQCLLNLQSLQGTDRDIAQFAPSTCERLYSAVKRRGFFRLMLALTRGQQREIILDRTWECTKGAVPVVVIVGAVLAICPWLAPVAGLAGFIGGATMTYRLVRVGFEALPENQREAIKSKATEVGVEVPGVTDATTQGAGA